MRKPEAGDTIVAEIGGFGRFLREDHRAYGTHNDSIGHRGIVTA